MIAVQRYLDWHLDRLANSADLVVGQVWRGLLAVIDQAKGPSDARAKSHLLFASCVPQLRDQLELRFLQLVQWKHRYLAKRLVRSMPRRLLRVSRSVTEEVEIVSPAGVVQFASRLGDAAEGGHLDLAELLFPAPTRREASQLLATQLVGTDWWQALEASARRAMFSPDGLAGRVAASYALGRTQQQIAAEVRPYLDGVRYRARRVARTWGIAIAQEVQMRVYRELGDLVIGYQVHATRDANTRPWHLERDGTIYYRDPTPGQKGMLQMPRPPLEPFDPSERPEKAPRLAWNCRCYLTPVLR